MIVYFPDIYPDELVYSWFCRYYVHSGCLSHKMALQELYCKRSDNPSKEFIGNLNWFWSIPCIPSMHVLSLWSRREKH